MFIVTAYDSRINSTVTGASYDTAAAALDAIRCCIPSAVALVGDYRPVFESQADADREDDGLAVASIDYDPAAVDAFVVRAAGLADEGGTIDASAAVGLFPGVPTAHHAMTISAAVRRQFPGLSQQDLDRSFERVWS